MTGPRTPPFQYSLRTLLLLFVVLGASLAVFGAWGIVVFAPAVGLAIYLHVARLLRYLVLVLLCLMCLIGWLLLPVVREQAYRPSCFNRMHQLGLALHNYQEANNGRFPPAYIADKTGKPIQSWRTLLLPYMEYDALYKSLDLTHPWDAPKNKAKAAFSLKEFVCPSDPTSDAHGAMQTNYFAVVGPNAAWSGGKPRKLADFGNQASRTIMLVEVADSGVAWAEPKDFSLDALGIVDGNSRTLSMSSNHRPVEEFFYTYDCASGVVVAMADGSVTFLRTDNLSPEKLRQIL
jgi:hypothetical protein